MICKVCRKEIESNAKFCKHCGAKATHRESIILAVVICSLLFLCPSGNHFVAFLGGLLVCLGFVFFAKEVKNQKTFYKEHNIPDNQDFNKIKLEARNKEIRETVESDGIAIDVFFVKASSYRKKDDKLDKDVCTLTFKGDSFFIEQGDKKIENLIKSIYTFRWWDYKDDEYFAIKMRSHSDYMFRVDSKVNDKLAKIKYAFNIDEES